MSRADARCSAVLALGWLAVSPPAATAQIKRVEVTPLAGGYIPTKTLGPVQLDFSGQTFTADESEMKTAGVFGGRIAMWPGESWAVEGSFLWSGSDMRATVGQFVVTRDAEVRAGSLKLVYRPSPGTTGTDVVVNAGIGGIQHRGAAFRLTTGQLDVAGAFGAGLRVEMTEQVTLRIDGEGFIYSWSAGSGSPGNTQLDIMLSAGLALRLRR